eukprot:211928_1
MRAISPPIYSTKRSHDFVSTYDCSREGAIRSIMNCHIQSIDNTRYIRRYSSSKIITIYYSKLNRIYRFQTILRIQTVTKTAQILVLGLVINCGCDGAVDRIHDHLICDGLRITFPIKYDHLTMYYARDKEIFDAIYRTILFQDDANIIIDTCIKSTK